MGNKFKIVSNPLNYHVTDRRVLELESNKRQKMFRTTIWTEKQKTISKFNNTTDKIFGSRMRGGSKKSGRVRRRAPSPMTFTKYNLLDKTKGDDQNPFRQFEIENGETEEEDTSPKGKLLRGSKLKNSSSSTIGEKSPEQFGKDDGQAKSDVLDSKNQFSVGLYGFGEEPDEDSGGRVARGPQSKDRKGFMSPNMDFVGNHWKTNPNFKATLTEHIAATDNQNFGGILSGGMNVLAKLIKENNSFAHDTVRYNRTATSRRAGSMSFSKKESKFAAPLMRKIASKGFLKKRKSSIAKIRNAIQENPSHRDVPHFDFANVCLKGRETPEILVTTLPVNADISRSTEKPIK